MNAERLVIGCDLSGTTHSVLEAGISLADALDMKPVALHVDDYGTLLAERFHAIDAGALARMCESYEGAARAELQRFFEKMGWPSERIETHVMRGRAPEELARFAAGLHSPLLVLGSRGKHHLASTRLGTTAIKVLRLSRLPVLTVDVRRPWKPLRRILFATALAGAQHEPLGLIARLAAASDASVTVLHVSDLNRGAVGPYDVPAAVFERHHALCLASVERLAAKLQEAAGHLRHLSQPVGHRVTWASDIAGCIADVARENEADLIVVGSHASRVQTILGSVAESVLHRAATSVLTVPDHGETRDQEG